jgi:hypothetical protein
MQIPIESLVSILETDIWVAIGAIGAIVALLLTYFQLRASRIIAAADFLIRLENNFTAGDMLKKRKKILLIVKKDPTNYVKIDNYNDVFNFFEELGLLVRKRILPTELVWSEYCIWTLYYWSIFKEYVGWVRKYEDDHTLYCEFEYLFKKMLKFEERKLKKKKIINHEKIAEFIDDEINLLTKEIDCN